MHIDEETLSGITLEIIDLCCRNEGMAAKFLDAGDLLQSVSTALTFRGRYVGAKAQRKIVDIKSGDFILQVSLVGRPSKLTRENWLGGAQELTSASRMPDA